VVMDHCGPYLRNLEGFMPFQCSNLPDQSDPLMSHPIFKDKTECITICMPGSSSTHIVSSLVNNQQQY
jgi:hypothetical protein